VKRVLKWIGISLGGLVALALVAAGVLYMVSGSRLSAKHAWPAETLAVPTDGASIARGEHLVTTRACGGCHGADLGGNVFADAGPFGLLAAPNLTRGRGGRTPALTDAEWEVAIRHGIRRDSTGLLIMPSEVFNGIADADIAPMIAYLKQLPPVDREIPPTKLRIVGRMLLGAGPVKTAATLSPATPHVAAVDTTPGLEYGRYLVAVSGCAACHGPSFSGGEPNAPEGKPPSNLTPTGIGHYSEDDFKKALRTGERPRDAGKMSVEMPWQYYAKLTDGEIHSIWTFLKSLPPKQFGEQ
jgi:cytochrome c553